MEAIDELIDAAQTFYEDARRDENGRSRSWEHCYRVFRDARTDPSPDRDYLSLHLAFYRLFRVGCGWRRLGLLR